MRTILRATGAAILTFGILSISSVAYAAEEQDQLLAVTANRGNAKVVYDIAPGQTIAPLIAVTNRGRSDTRAVVHVRALNDMVLPRAYTNCLYYTDANVDGAFCEVDVIRSGQTVGAGFTMAAKPGATKTDALIFQWYTPARADASGGIMGLARAAAKGSVIAAGQGSTFTPVPVDSVSGLGYSVGFNYFALKVPPATRPSMAPPSRSAPSAPVPPKAPVSGSGSAQATRSASPSGQPGGVAAGGTAGDSSGDSSDKDAALPKTGSATATAAFGGAVLLLAGGVGFLLARRRRTRFTA